MADDEGIVADQYVLDDEPHDSLPLQYIERVGRATQSCQKLLQSLRQAQEHRTVVDLVRDCLSFRAQRLLTLAQWWHSLAQLLKGYKPFLIGVENSFNALCNTSEFPLQELLALLRWFGRASYGESSIEFVLYQRWILK